MAFWLKTQHFGKITTFDKNHVFHDFCVSVIFYCPYLSCMKFIVLLFRSRKLRVPVIT